MSEILRFQNFPELNIMEKTSLSADSAANATSISVENVQNYAVDDIVVIGGLATSQAEKKQLTSSNSSTQALGFAALTFAHNEGEDVIKIRGDQIRIYRAANVDGTQPDDSDFVTLTTVDIVPNKSYTEFIDTDGDSGYWYKHIFRNSVSGALTDIAESEAFRGGNYGHYATIEQVRRSAGLIDNTDIVDEMIEESRNEAENIVKGYIIAAGYYLPLDPPYPASVVRFVKQLASAFLLQDEYGTSVEGSDKDGYAKEKSVYDKLDKVQDGTIKLVDVALETEVSQKADTSGWPDDSTATATKSNHGGKPKFTMSKKW